MLWKVIIKKVVTREEIKLAIQNLYYVAFSWLWFLQVKIFGILVILLQCIFNSNVSPYHYISTLKKKKAA